MVFKILAHNFMFWPSNFLEAAWCFPLLQKLLTSTEFSENIEVILSWMIACLSQAFR